MQLCSHSTTTWITRSLKNVTGTAWSLSKLAMAADAQTLQCCEDMMEEQQDIHKWPVLPAIKHCLAELEGQYKVILEFMQGVLRP